MLQRRQQEENNLAMLSIIFSVEVSWLESSLMPESTQNSSLFPWAPRSLSAQVQVQVSGLTGLLPAVLRSRFSCQARDACVFTLRAVLVCTSPLLLPSIQLVPSCRGRPARPRRTKRKQPQTLSVAQAWRLRGVLTSSPI